MAGFLLCSLTQMPEVNSKVRCTAQGLGQSRLVILLGCYVCKIPSAHGNFLTSNGSQSVIPQISSITHELVRNAYFQAPPQFY